MKLVFLGNSTTMLIDPESLADDLDRLEAIEKTTLRLVTQAVFDYRQQAQFIFANETDKVADIAEDITREALDRMGVSRIDQRLFGKVDYKRAKYLFLPDFAIRQALFVDSKAENVSGNGTATLQITQLSMRVQQIRNGQIVDEQGRLPKIIPIGESSFLTTTVFVKYNYTELEPDKTKSLHSITIAALPNGLLQDRYNPSPTDTIFIAGRNAPTLGEEFRTRLSFNLLRQKSAWRVQKFLASDSSLNWQE